MAAHSAFAPQRVAPCQHRALVSWPALRRVGAHTVRGTHKWSVQAQFDVYVKADPTDSSKLGDCPFSHRVLLALEEKKADYERHLIDLKNKPDWFLKLTEKGSTPVLQVNEEDRCITDSAEILSYLDEKIPRPHLGSPSDLPEEMKDLLPTFVKYLQSQGPDGFKQMTALRGELEGINSYFKANGPLVHGREISAADCVIAPLLYQVEIACSELKEVDLFATLNGIAKYNDNIRSRDSWKHTGYAPEAVIEGWRGKLPKA